MRKLIYSELLSYDYDNNTLEQVLNDMSNSSVDYEQLKNHILDIAEHISNFKDRLTAKISNDIDISNMLSVNEVSNYLNISKQAVIKNITTKKLKAIRTNNRGDFKIKLDSLLDFCAMSHKYRHLIPKIKEIKGV
jgi:excisionase family DNA binding protein